MRIVVMGLIFGFVILTLILGLFMGCASNVGDKNPQVVSQMEELDRNRVLALGAELNELVVTSMNLPSHVTNVASLKEVVFAEHRRIAVVTFQIVFTANNVVMGNLLVSYIVVKDKEGSWKLSHVLARDAKEQNNGESKSDGAKL